MISIERRVAVLMYFPALRNGCIQLRAIPKLAGTEILCDFADALADVVSAEANRSSLRADASQSKMNVRVLGVVVGYRHPFERRAEVPLHP